MAEIPASPGGKLTAGKAAPIKTQRQATVRDLFVVLTVAAVVSSVWRWESTTELLYGYIYSSTAVVAGIAFLFGWWRRRWSGSVIVTLGFAIWCLYLMPAVTHPRRFARMMQSSNQVKQIALALCNYENAYGQFPPAYIADENGKPMHSWRVLILPYLEEQTLYAQYNFSEPWDSPANLKVAAQMPAEYRYPADGRLSKPQCTPYVAIVDVETMWPDEQSVEFEDFVDLPENTLSILEWPESNIVWTEPRDLDLPTLHKITHPPREVVKSKRRHPRGRIVFALADGSVRSEPLHEVPVSQFRAILTRSGGDSHELLLFNRR